MKQRNRVYEEPIMIITMLEAGDIITMSGGDEGDITSNKGSYSELFGKSTW